MDYIHQNEQGLNQRGIPGPSALAGYDPATQQAIVAQMMKQREMENARMAQMAMGAGGSGMGGTPTGGPPHRGGGGGGGSGSAMVQKGVFNPLDTLQRQTSKTGY